MTSPASPDAGPDGHGPIDAVITWVDGTDPAFCERRQLAAERLKRENPGLAQRSEMRFAAARYVQHDEIRYCVRSILNHAPWIRRIWLVTDDQFPTVFDRKALDTRLTIINHRLLFGEFADALPVFNSEAIGVMLWKIEGLSDRFVYFNDDVFLTKPVRPDDFFQGRNPVIHGKWIGLDASSPAWLRRRVRSAGLFGFDEDRFFKEAHTPISLSRPAIAELFDRCPGLLADCARRPFRSTDGHSIVALHNHFCLSEGRAAIDDVNRWLVFGSYPEDSSEEDIIASLQRIASNDFFSTCFNVLESFVARMPSVYAYLEAGTGPKVAFER